MSEEMFAEAVRAAKTGQRRRARDLFTRLLKTQPENADYWLWMSATVESEKEQLFCLQKALKFDPNSIAARRGLVMLGALKLEEAALPPPPRLDEFTPTMPAAKAAGRLGEFLAKPFNRAVLFAAGAGLALVVVAGLVLIAIFAPQIFNPPKVVVVTNTPVPTNTVEIIPTAMATSAPEDCGRPQQVNPATPLAAYLCVAAFTTPLFVPTESIAPPQEAYQIVRNAYRSQSWDRVLDFGDQAIAAAPNNPYPYFYVAEAQRNTGNYRDAESNYQRALAQNNGFVPAYYGRALARFARNNASNALRDLDASLEREAGFLPAYVTRAEYYSANGNAAPAVADLEQARALAPENPDVLARLALAYAENNQPQQAILTADEALALDPSQVIAYYARGRASLALDDAQAAQADLSLSYPYLIDPASFSSLFPVASALNVANAYAANALYAYGATQAALGEDAIALEALNDALSRLSSLPLARLVRGQILLRAGQYEAARADFNAVIGQLQAERNSPRLAEAYIGNGQALLASDLPDGATSNFLAATRILTDSFDAHLGLGQALLAADHADEAIEPLTVAVAVARDEAEQALALYWRAEAHLAARRQAEAVKDLQAAVALTSEASTVAVLPTAEARLKELGFAATATRTPQPPTATSAAKATATRAPSRTPSPAATTSRTPAVAVSATP